VAMLVVSDLHTAVHVPRLGQQTPRARSTVTSNKRTRALRATGINEGTKKSYVLFKMLHNNRFMCA